MISIFGIASVVVALASLAVILLHNRIMNKRAPVDAYFAELDDLLRDRIENLYHSSSPDTKLHDLCSQYMDSSLSDMITALTEIDRAVAAELHTEEHETAQTIYEAIAVLNQSIDEYNRYIAGSLPVALMAQVLGLAMVEPV